MPQHLIAIDISSKNLRLAVIETTLRKAELVGLYTLAAGDAEAKQAAFAEIKEKVGGSIDSVIVTHDVRSVSTRLLRFPFGDLRKVEDAVGFELEGQIPYDLDDTAVSWHVVSRTPKQLEVLAAVTPKKVLAERLAELTEAGLEPRAVVLADAALAELLPSTPEPTAVLSLGDVVSHLVVLRDGMRFARTLRAGGADVDQALARAFKLEVDVAKQAKEKEARIIAADAPASDEERRIPDAIVAGLAPLITHLTTTFKSLPLEDSPQKIVITGGLSRLPGLVDFLAERLGIPVELLDLAAVARDTGSRVEVVGPEFAIVLGMALGLVRHGRNAPLNFRRGSFAYQGDLQLYRGQVTRIALGISTVLILAIAGSVVRYSMVSSEETRLNRGFCEATKKIVGREICDPTAALATMRQTPGAGEGTAIPPYSAGALFEMMSKAIGSGIDVSFDDLEFRADGRVGEPDRISGKGEAATFDTTAEMVTALKRDPCVQDAEVSRQKKTRDGGRVEFSLTVKVGCPPGILPGSTSGASASAAALPGDAPTEPPERFAPPSMPSVRPQVMPERFPPPPLPGEEER